MQKLVIRVYMLASRKAGGAAFIYRFLFHLCKSYLFEILNVIAFLHKVFTVANDLSVVISYYLKQVLTF